MPGFYIAELTSTQTEIKVSNEEYHHIINVFRHKLDDKITLINGKGIRCKARIKEICKSYITLLLENMECFEPAKIKIACAFSLLKNKNDLWIVEKLTELGVTDLFPMQTINSVKLSKENTVEKMKKTAIAAAKQCDNPWIPTIHDVLILDKTLNKVINMGYLPVVASERLVDINIYSFHKTITNENICFFIGPEGGFDDTEFDLFEKNNIIRFNIPGNILRAETAAIVAVAIAGLGNSQIL